MEDQNKTCCKKICPKFVVASLISAGTVIFGCVMVAVNPNATLAPFYASLITGGLAFWVPPPKFAADE